MERRAALIVLDTHAWLWYVDAPERLSPRARTAVRMADVIGVPTVCCWEIATLVRHRKIALRGDVREWVAAALAVGPIEPIALSHDIAADAGLLPDEFPGDPADRIIYATARRHRARLVTRDTALRKFDRDATIW